MTGRATPLGELVVEARGETYRLHFGMSVIADMQAKHGQKFNDLLAGAGSMPDLNVVMDIFAGSLQRHHPDVAGDRWVIDDIVAENQNLLPQLLSASSPEPEEGAAPGNGEAAA
jgi:hypothetical protein